MGFIYNGGEKFTFAGDDDVFTYIDGKKVVDLGGIHAQETAAVDLDTLGLEVGRQYQLDFFFAERHVTDSHFRVEIDELLLREHAPCAPGQRVEQIELVGRE
ncbi:fibro-slime domain-containing protein [Sorangium sp. So ce321]|uniref:fibro-slime domain-containing protein n=1 Tax=Sorangium sp. So ce321 TaxID=3133300 RepID=UPI003F62ED37